MSQPAAPVRMSYAEYVAAESVSDVKHEYLRGQVHAMAGGTPEHAALAMAIGGELRMLLRGKPCRVFSSDLRVRVEATDLSTYPDVTVVCGQLERSTVDRDAATNPVLLVEVLSDSSEAYDRGEKFAHYRRLASLQEYLIVSQREPRLELFRREADGSWKLIEAGSGERLTLASLGIELNTDEVYRDPLVTS
jgi:Uma2 family endonuclease